MIDYSKIMEVLKTRLLEFSIDESFSENPVVAFGFLSAFIKVAYRDKNYSVIERSVSLIDDLFLNDDPDIAALFDEIAIGLYDESPDVYEDFKARLSADAQKYFGKTIEKWVGNSG